MEKNKMKYVVTAIIFVIAIIAAFGFYQKSPKTKKARPQKPIPLVETMALDPQSEKVYVEAQGSVIPAKQIKLQSEVEGRVITQNPELIPGGIIKEGELILQIDPIDYRLKVKELEADVEGAEFELKVEEGRRVIAQREWELLKEEISTSPEGKSLALREPHLQKVQARLQAAKAKLGAAKLAEKRTTIKAPFNALVLEEFVDVGQIVGRQTHIATLVGADQFWAQVSVPMSRVKRISFPENGDFGSAVRIISGSGTGTSFVRHGRVKRLLGNLDPEGRMARVLLTIDDPLNLDVKKVSHKGDRILIGSYVTVKIDAGAFNNVYKIPRQALREGDAIWTVDKKSSLQIRKVKVLWRRKNEALVSISISADERLILSRLQSPLPGMHVRTKSKPVK